MIIVFYHFLPTQIKYCGNFWNDILHVGYIPLTTEQVDMLHMQ